MFSCAKVINRLPEKLKNEKFPCFAFLWFPLLSFFQVLEICITEKKLENERYETKKINKNERKSLRNQLIPHGVRGLVKSNSN